MSVTTNNNVITLNIDAVQIKRNTAAGWTADTTTILKAGEIGAETDTGKIKVGDGVKTWANLVYAGGDTTALTARITALEGITVIDCGDLSAQAGE